MSLVLAHGNRVSMYSFSGELEREWTMNAPVTFMKVVGGPSRKEGLLVGTEEGQVLKIFINNSFPVNLYTASAKVVSADLSASKKKLSVIDGNKNLIVIDLASMAQVFTETKV